MVSYEMHHVWPLGYHGPDESHNIVKICCNAHSDIHFLLHKMLTGKPYKPAEYGPSVRDIAKRGFDAITAYADSIGR